MKTKILLLSLLFSSATFFASAQEQSANRGGKREFNREQMQARADTVRAMRMDFIVSKADLTETELAQFLPLYQEYQAKLREARQASRQAMRAARQNETAVDYAQLTNNFVNLRIREAELLKEYSAKFSQVMPAEKVWKVFQAEKRFHQKALNKRGGKYSSGKFRDKERRSDSCKRK